MSRFADLRLNHVGGQPDESFWPSFTDIMMVVVMIFLITSATLILRNSELIRQITESEEAEKLAAAMAEDSIAENATLEERMQAVQHQLSMARLQQLKTMEEKFNLEKQIRTLQEQLAALELSRAELDALLATSSSRGDNLEKTIERLQEQLSQSERQRHAMAIQLESSLADLESSAEKLESSADELAATNQTLNELQQHYNLTRLELTQMIARLAESGEKIDRLQREKLTNLGTVQLSEEKLARLRDEYTILKSKYDKLVRPARTTKGKYVVAVRYSRIDGNHIIELKKPEDATFNSIDRETMHAQLSALKTEHADELYVKIIIPDDSELSYNEAWSFTADVLNKYDYYHQGDYKPVSPLE